MSVGPFRPSRAPRNRLRGLAAGAAAAWAFACGVLATSDAGAADPAPYPGRPIRLVVPSAPGTGDFVPREVAKRLAERVGQPVIIENRPGASYNIASDVVAKSAPDGYTLLYTGSVITVLPSVLGSAAVDPVASFVPVTKLVDVPLIVVAHESLGVRTLGELVALAKRRPGQLAYASPGIGTVPHLVATIISRQAGIELLHVPYPNARQLLVDVVSGEVPLYFTFLVAVDAQIRSGVLRPLVVASQRRMPQLPDVPTVVEAGYPEAVVEPWLGVLAPAGTPGEIVDRLNRELVEIIRAPDMRSVLGPQGIVPIGSTREQFAADIRNGVVRWAVVAKAAGVRPQ